jgi:hypothetical protein
MKTACLLMQPPLIYAIFINYETLLFPICILLEVNAYFAVITVQGFVSCYCQKFLYN